MLIIELTFLELLFVHIIIVDGLSEPFSGNRGKNHYMLNPATCDHHHRANIVICTLHVFISFIAISSPLVAWISPCRATGRRSLPRAQQVKITCGVSQVTKNPCLEKVSLSFSSDEVR